MTTQPDTRERLLDSLDSLDRSLTARDTAAVADQLLLLSIVAPDDADTIIQTLVEARGLQ